MQEFRSLTICVRWRGCPINGSLLHKKKDKRKVTYSSGGNDTERNFVLVGKEKRKYLRNVKVIPGELQHRLVDW